VWLSVVFCKAIIAGIKKSSAFIFEYLKMPAHRFWIGTTIFLIASILVGGQTFNEIAKENNLYGILGYAIEVAVDTASVFCILARQGAVRRGDDFGKNLYTMALVLCAAFSTLANAYMVRVHYVAPASVNDPFWYAVAFALGAAPPLFIIVLSLTSDYVTDQEGTKLNPDQYEQSEKDRIRFDQIRLDSLIARKEIQDQINTLKGVTNKKDRVPAWSFMGFTVYQKQQLSEMPEMTEIVNLKKIVEELRVDIHRQQEATVLPGASLQTPAQNLSIPTSTKNGVVVDDVVDEKRQPVDDLFVDSLLDGDDDTFDDDSDDMYVSSQLSSVVDTGERETVNWQATIQKKPQPRITVKLPEVHGTRAKKERITDNLAATTKKTSTRKVTAVDAKERIRRLLKKQPDMEPTEIAAKVGVSRQYAHKVKAQIIAEKTA
jgi:hypothetical protein